MNTATKIFITGAVIGTIGFFLMVYRIYPLGIILFTIGCLVGSPIGTGIYWMLENRKRKNIP